MEEKKTKKTSTGKVAGKSQATRRKVQEETPEAVYIYHDGDDIHKIAKLLTGHSYMVFKLLEYNEKDFHELKDGDILRWGI